MLFYYESVCCSVLLLSCLSSSLRLAFRSFSSLASSFHVEKVGEIHVEVNVEIQSSRKQGEEEEVNVPEIGLMVIAETEAPDFSFARASALRARVRDEGSLESCFISFRRCKSLS